MHDSDENTSELETSYSDNESTDNKLYKPTAPNRSVKISGLKHIGLLFDKEDGLSSLFLLMIGPQIISIYF